MSTQDQMVAAPKQQACRYPMCSCVVKIDGSWQGCKVAPAAGTCAERVEPQEQELRARFVRWWDDNVGVTLDNRSLPGHEVRALMWRAMQAVAAPSTEEVGQW